MMEYFKSQIEKNSEKEKFKLFYFIESIGSGDFPQPITLEMKSIGNDELESFDFSELDFVRLGPTVCGVYLPSFKNKNT